MKPISAQGQGVKGAGKNQPVDCCAATARTECFQEAWEWLRSHKENIVLSAEAAAPFIFPAQRPASPDLFRGTDPVSSACTFLAKIACRFSQSPLEVLFLFQREPLCTWSHLQVSNCWSCQIRDFSDSESLHLPSCFQISVISSIMFISVFLQIKRKDVNSFSNHISCILLILFSCYYGMGRESTARSTVEGNDMSSSGF